MRILAFVLVLAGCRSSEVKTLPDAPLDAKPAARAVRPEPSFAAKRLAAESGALGLAEVRFLSGESEIGPLARHELGQTPGQAKRAQVIAWADAKYGEGDKALGRARAEAICDHLKALSCEPFNMAEKAGLWARMTFRPNARIKSAAAMSDEPSHAIVLFYK